MLCDLGSCELATGEVNEQVSSKTIIKHLKAISGLTREDSQTLIVKTCMYFVVKLIQNIGAVGPSLYHVTITKLSLTKKNEWIKCSLCPMTCFRKKKMRQGLSPPVNISKAVCTSCYCLKQISNVNTWIV